MQRAVAASQRWRHGRGHGQQQHRQGLAERRRVLLSIGARCRCRWGGVSLSSRVQRRSRSRLSAQGRSVTYAGGSETGQDQDKDALSVLVFSPDLVLYDSHGRRCRSTRHFLCLVLFLRKCASSRRMTNAICTHTVRCGGQLPTLRRQAKIALGSSRVQMQTAIMPAWRPCEIDTRSAARLRHPSWYLG